MKNILSFDKYHLIKEADEPVMDLEGAAPAPEEQAAAPSEPADEPEKDFETPETNSAVLLKQLMGELRSHLIYWLHFGKLSEILDADNDDITYEKRGLCLWAVEKDENEREKYQWRIKVVEGDITGKVERIERIQVIFDVFDFNKEYLIRSNRVDVKLDKFTEEFLITRIKNMKKSILRVPNSDDDVKKVKDNNKRLLGDDIY